MDHNIFYAANIKVAYITVDEDLWQLFYLFLLFNIQTLKQ